MRFKYRVDVCSSHIERNFWFNRSPKIVLLRFVGSTCDDLLVATKENLDSYAGTALRDSSKIQRKLDLSREKLRITALYNIRIHHFPCQSFRAQVAKCLVIGCVDDISFHEEKQNRETSWQIYFVIKMWHLIDMRSQSIIMTIMDTNGFFSHWAIETVCNLLCSFTWM